MSKKSKPVKALVAMALNAVGVGAKDAQPVELDAQSVDNPYADGKADRDNFPKPTQSPTPPAAEHVMPGVSVLIES